MLLTDNIELEIWVEGHLLELADNRGLNLRFNNVIFNPTKFSNKTAEYSFSFDIPATPSNNKIFGFPNVMSSSNKFSRRFNVDVVAGGVLLFSGTMILNSYKEGYYNVNLVSIKVLSLADIFGDDKLSDLNWYVNFNGIQTINNVNQYSNGKYFFPLVSYGVFQKAPYYIDEVENEYTSKFLFDKWNQWYYSSFYPSMNMLEVVKRCFEQKGYVVKGDAYADPILNNIYLSTNLANEQVPAYNYGNDRLGTVKITNHWSNGDNSSNKRLGLTQDLTYQYEPMGFAGSPYATRAATRPNYDMCDLRYIEIWDMLDSGNTFVSTTATTATGDSRTYLYDDNECVIIVPADGFYEIELTATGTVKTGDGGIKADHYFFDGYGNPKSGIPQTAEALNAKSSAPIELQVLRNYDESDSHLELIYGKNKLIHWSNGINAISAETITTCFPHEKLYNQMPPCSNANNLTSTVYNGDKANNNSASSTTDSSDSGNTGGGGGGSFGSRAPRKERGGGGEGRRPTTGGTTGGYAYLGYNYNNSHRFMAYDPAVNDQFVCGLSTLSDGVAATRKNGKSWTKLYTSRTDNIYEMDGYDLTYYDNSGGTITTATSFNSNSLASSPSNYCNVGNSGFTGAVHTVMWLNRNDVISVKAILRRYTNYSYESHPSEAQLNYYWGVDSTLQLRAVSPSSYAKFADNASWGMESQFDKQLRLGNFLSNETTMASFVENVANAFNLDISQDNREITISRRRVPVDRLSSSVVDINDRVNPDEIKTNKVDYPSKYSVAFSTDKEEYGFVQSCPIDKQEEDDWEKYADSGYSIIRLDNDSYNVDEKKIALDFSYDWYANWTWYKTNNDGTQDSAVTHTVNIPVISKDEYLVDNYKYEEAASKDGFSLKQRMWFKQPRDVNTYFWSASTPREKIYASIPINHCDVNQYGDQFNLNYKAENYSILDQYFDVLGLSAANDEVGIDIYLTVDEYMLLKAGALVKVNDDLYRILEIKGYDPTNNNKTTLKLMKIGL